MTYATTNPPQLLAGGPASGIRLWAYKSADVHTDVDEADYFSNGYALGMRVGDFVLVGKTTATIGATLHYVTTATAGGACTVAAAILA